MKICWDMLEGVWLTTKGNFKKGTATYIEMDSCKVCGNPYLTKKNRLGPFCSNKCANTGKNNPMYGKTLSDYIKKRLSKRFSGTGNYNYRDGISIIGLTSYNTYKDRLKFCEDIRKQIDTDLLEARCAYCGQWYTPKRVEVTIRLNAIDHLNKGEGRLYCSDNCKQACPTYGQVNYPKGFKHATSREVSTYLRQMVLERDNWTCQICGKTIKETQLHCHHMDPVAQNPIFQNDMDSCITLCKGCHKSVHKQIGCRYIDLRCKKKQDHI